MNTPKTIKHPDNFYRSVGSDFDGVFDWEWMQDCWPNPHDKPMDIDGFKERRGHCLIIETKDPGKDIPLGQRIGLEALHRKRDVSVMIIWGKQEPQHGEFWFPNSRAVEKFVGADHARDLVRLWYAHANTAPRS